MRTPATILTRAANQAHRGRTAHAATMAVRVAVAAVLAWAVATPLGGVADDYHYYAPFGAVVVMSTTVMRSVTASAQVMLALGLGAPLAMVVQQLSLPTAVALELVVGVGTLLARLPWLGATGSWVPISGLFVLILGQGDPEPFVMGYLGLTMLGALVGTALNLVFPPLLLVQAERAQESLRQLLVDQLVTLADSLDPEGQRPRDLRRHDVQRRGRNLQDLVGEALGGPPVNWRVRRSRSRADRLWERGDALVRLSLLVAEVTGSMYGVAEEDAPTVSWGGDVNHAAGEALRATAHVLRPETEHGRDADFAAAEAAVDGLVAVVSDAWSARGSDLFSAAALAETLRRTLTTLHTKPLHAEVPDGAP